MNKKAFFLFPLIFGTLAAFAQLFSEKGMPLLQNYAPAQYQNRGKIWDIQSAPNGMVYMAADKGLLEFDGKNWNSFKGSDGFTRSLLVINDSLLYTGSDLDFGVWNRNRYQVFEYTSLYPFQEDVAEINEEFWGVYKQDDKVLFVSSQSIYIYKNQHFTKISAPTKFSGSFNVNDSLYFADNKAGIFLFNGMELKQVFAFPPDLNFEIAGIYHHPQGTVLVTTNSGLYLFSAGKLNYLNNAASQNLKTAKVFSFTTLGDKYLAFGTILKGLYITDINGRIIHQINKNKGLPNNTILSLHYSPSGKLWMGMDYGVTALDLQKRITTFYDFRGDFGTGSSALLYNGIFYLGTNQGLYQSKWDDLNNDSDFSRFQLIPGTEGQVWCLEEIENTILFGHDRGLFILNGNNIQKLNNTPGVWTIVPYKDYLLTGNYNGISVYKKAGKSWTFVKKMELILGSCNQLIIEKENILWVNIPNFGVIRAVLGDNLYPTERLIIKDKEFDGDNPILVKSDSGMHVLTDNFRYTFSSAEKKFINKVSVSSQPEIEDLVVGIHPSKVINQDYKFYPVYNGFALKYLKPDDDKKRENIAISLRKIEAFGRNHESAVFYPGASIPFKQNNLKIECIVPNHDNVLYQYKLEESGKWSPWNSKNTFEFFNLKRGKYTLFVKASVNGEVTQIHSVSFRIKAPLYHSWYAYLSYFLITILFVSGLFALQKLALKKQRKKHLIKEQLSLREQAEKHRQEVIMLEQDKLKAEFNKLKQQLRIKTIELACKSRVDEEKNRILISLKEKFERIQKEPALAKMTVNEINRILESYINNEVNTFEIQIDELHQEFYKKLKTSYPGLSTHDLRLSAYLKIGLNSKEIAEILNILPSSAFISRSRLRKKLNIKADEDLYEFLNSV